MTPTCMNEDVSLQVVSTSKCSVTVITNKVFLHFGWWTILISTCALMRTAKIMVQHLFQMPVEQCTKNTNRYSAFYHKHNGIVKLSNIPTHNWSELDENLKFLWNFNIYKGLRFILTLNTLHKLLFFPCILFKRLKISKTPIIFSMKVRFFS